MKMKKFIAVLSMVAMIGTLAVGCGKSNEERGLSNNFINLFKSTSIGFMIGFKDMMAAVSMETSRTYRFLEGYLATVVIYWIIISALNLLQSKMEKTSEQNLLI